MEEVTSLSDLEGEDWDKWISVLGRDMPEDDEESEGDAPKPEPVAECKRLPTEDMILFGLCPEVDPFVAVVCEYCENLVKPQFFKEHIALRHSDCVRLKVKVKDSREDIKVVNNVPIKPRKSSSLTSLIKEETPIHIEKKNDSPSKLIHSPQVDKNTSTPQTSVPVSPVSNTTNKSSERRLYPITNRSIHKLNSALSSPDKQKPVEVRTSATNTIPIIKIPINSSSNKVDTTPTPVLQSTSTDVEQDLVVKKKKKSSPSKEKVYSPDIHCGVWNEQTKKNCLRALTCRTHSLTLKRAVPMRSKLFDELLAEHRASSKAKKEKEEFTPLFIQTAIPVKAPVVESSLNEAMSQSVSNQRFTGSLAVSLTGSMSSRLTPWRVPDLAVPIALEPSRNSSQTTLTHMEPALPGSFLPAEPTRLPQLKPIFPKSDLTQSVLTNGFTSATISESLLTSVHPKPLSVCSLSLHNDGGYISPHRRITMLRRTIRAAVEDPGSGGPICTDMYGFPMPPAANHSTIKTVLTNICGRAAQRSASQRNAKISASKSVNPNKQPVGKNVPKNATLVFKSFPVGNQATLSKDTSKMTPLHAFTLLGANLKTQTKANLKRHTGESFKENDIVKCARKSNPVLPTELFTKTSQQSGHVVAVAYSNVGKVSTEMGGTSLLRTDRSEHSPGESLLVSNRTAVGLLATRPHSSVGDTLPQLPTGMTPHHVATATADMPSESLPMRATKSKGPSLIRPTDGKGAKGKIGSQSVTCLAGGQQTMMALHHVLTPQMKVQVSPKTSVGGTNLKFIPQAQSMGLAINAKTFLLKKDHGET